ncbi:VWA domain-containing protein [Altererythrobacter xixiisoli]|uniref:VWA domain-containing protein n=1 Tax=Croceibacterium xixiisoli TaxID=1476466 RepID=A0A6I4U0K5_9SPHN|nr:VWA domain-containing protein [Croceibacterium xixiisoli]MXP00852.1 VWA domain-containing protein [Croceibacterium xixiisoli]
MSDPELSRRWRLALGRYAERSLPNGGLSREDLRADRALDYLYAREMEKRGLRRDKRKSSGAGSLDPSQLTPLGWLGELRELFPQSVYETVQAHAIDNLGMADLLSDPGVLEAMEPSKDLLKALIAFKGKADPAMREKIREVTRKVVEDILRRLRPRIEAALAGKPNRFRRSQIKSMQNFDWRATIRDNLKNWDAERGVIVADRLRFYGRSRRRLPWTVILCVDQSGSMLSSTIYAAVMASILSSLPAVDVKLVVFDTSVVDLSSEAHDAVEVLMSVQLGGGTNIGAAVEYCETLISQPTRSIFVLISDFEEGAPVGRMLAGVRRMASARVTMLGLGALSDDAAPVYDRRMAERLAGCGMQIAALTPDHFAEWIGEKIA